MRNRDKSLISERASSKGRLRTSRRNLLKGVGAASLVGAAGCIGGGSGGGLVAAEKNLHPAGLDTTKLLTGASYVLSVDQLSDYANTYAATFPLGRVRALDMLGSLPDEPDYSRVGVIRSDRSTVSVVTGDVTSETALTLATEVTSETPSKEEIDASGATAYAAGDSYIAHKGDAIVGVSNGTLTDASQYLKVAAGSGERASVVSSGVRNTLYSQVSPSLSIFGLPISGSIVGLAEDDVTFALGGVSLSDGGSEVTTKIAASPVADASTVVEDNREAVEESLETNTPEGVDVVADTQVEATDGVIVVTGTYETSEPPTASPTPE